MGNIDALAAMISSRAQGSADGMIASSFPGLWFFRSAECRPTVKASAPTMYLAVAVQGRKRVKIEGMELDYSRRHYLIVRGEIPYEAAIVDATPDEPYLSLGLQLPPELVVRTLLEMADEQEAAGAEEAVPPAFISPLDDDLADALCRLLMSIDSAPERRVLAPLFLKEIVFRLLGTEAATVLRQVARGAADRDRIAKAIGFIERNATKRVTVNAIAKHVAMSPSHFAHRFKEIASLSPMQYLKRLRLQHARATLAERNRSIGEVATAVGYASAAHFTRDFKRHFGVAPGAYARGLF
ncbi:MAG: AraC family transcriptional regulator [Polyangiaceae bacterium]|nr:AraC family transcriptional regulator [Polyangiaceae bacterium]